MTTIQKQRKRPLLLEPGFLATAAITLPVIWFSAIGCIFHAKFFAVPCTGLLILFSVCWLGHARPAWYFCRRARTIFWFQRISLIAFCAALLLSIPATQWPHRLAFALSQPALESLADRVERGEALHLPLRAGLFLVTEARLGNISGIKADGQQPMLTVEDYGTGATVGFIRGEKHGYCTSNPRHELICQTPISPRWVHFDED